MVTKGKFEAQPVVDSYNYMYLVGFQPQNSPLTPSDLTQAYLLVRAARNSSTPIFAFYNCGANSGASQPHKHIQFIPLTDTEATDENEEDEESSKPPVEAYIRRLKIEDESESHLNP
jgi:ATP adenylyltransferase